MPKKTLHRSFSIDMALIEQAKRWAPMELSGNLNRMIHVALAELIDKYKRIQFEADMARMAADPALKKESARMTRQFRAADADGL